MSSLDLGAAQLAHCFFVDPTFIAVVLREYWFEFQDQMSVTKYDRWTHISCPEFKLGNRLYWQLHKIFGAIDAAAAKSTLIREGFEEYRPRFEEFLTRIGLSERGSDQRIPEDIDDLIGLLEFALTGPEKLEEEATQTRSTPSTYGTPHLEHPKKGGEPPETPYERSIRLSNQFDVTEVQAEDFEVVETTMPVRPMPTPRVVTAKDIAKFVHLEPKSLSRSSWPKPMVAHRGRRAAQWKWSDLRPVVEREFPDVDWDDF